jgi:ATP-binding cassette subfamily C protein LapB
MGTVLINLLSLALPIGILQFYDRVLPSRSEDTFAVLLAGLVLVAVLDGVLRIVRSLVLSWCGARYEYSESLRLLGHILHSDLTRFNQSTLSTHLDQVDSLEKVREFYSSQSILMLVDLPFVVVFLVLIWSFSGTLVLVPVSVMLLFLVISCVYGARLREAFSDQHLIDRRRQDFVLEVLNGIHSVKALAMEQLIMRRYERLQSQSADAITEVSRLSGIVQGLGSTLSQGVTVGFATLGSIQVVSGDLTVGALAAGTMLSGRVLQPSLKAMGLWAHLQSLRLAQDRIKQAYEAPLELLEHGEDTLALSGDIELVDIHFRHESSERELLAGVNLHVRAGEAIGITGPNGSGKSTLVNILMGFVTPASGAVKFDGHDIRELHRSATRAQIGLMPQHGTIFQGSILENMTLFRDGKAVEQALSLARRLGLDRQIMQLPDGLDTQIGSAQFTALSEGVRQLIVLVRSLVGEPRVIVFDDAASALDIEHDVKLLKMLEEYRGEHTMIVVSHRPSMLRMCDRCLRLDDGKLTELRRRSSVAPALPGDPSAGGLARAS